MVKLGNLCWTVFFSETSFNHFGNSHRQEVGDKFTAEFQFVFFCVRNVYCKIVSCFCEYIAVSREDHSDADCFVCVILSHGGDGFVYGQDGIVNLSELVNMFKGDECKTLAGKPKMFFVQVAELLSVLHAM